MSAANRKGPVFDPGLCRCCGFIKKCRVINVEYEFQGQKEVYSDMFVDCFGLMLSDLEGSPETARLICAACVRRLRDASAFRAQVLLCEERLLQASIHVHQPDGNTTIMSALSDASAFRTQVLLCEERLLQASIHVHQPNEGQIEIELKTEVIKEEVEEGDGDVFATDDHHVADGNDDNMSDTNLKQEDQKPKIRLKRRKAKTEAMSEREVSLRMQKLSRKLKILVNCGEEPKKPTVRLKAIDKDDKMFHNCATIVENSYVCPFETSFSDYHCIYCREIFTDPKDLREHTSTHDPKQYKELVRLNKKIPQIDVLRIDCRLCDTKIEDLTTFKTHITTVHQKYLFPKVHNEVLQFKLTLSHLACMECDSTFGYFHALRNHMAVHFGSCICDVCGEHFFEEKRLTQHLKTHEIRPDITYPCKECGKEFKSKHGRHLHIATTHKKEPTYQCGKCDEVFFSYALRCRHRIEVHGEKREFACEHCDKCYDNRKSWREHNRRAHLKISKHKCDICERMFYLPCQLKEHMTTHTGERNFRCEYCGKSYPRLRALRLHARAHGGDKYRCAACGAAFTQNVSLRNHVKKQHQHHQLDVMTK